MHVRLRDRAVDRKTRIRCVAAMVATARNDGRSIKSRFVALASILVVLSGLVETGGEHSTAQEAMPDTMATHPIVGAWRFVWDFGGGSLISHGIFHADVMYIQEPFVDGPMHFGVWQPTGERTADLRFHNLYFWGKRHTGQRRKETGYGLCRDAGADRNGSEHVATIDVARSPRLSSIAIPNEIDRSQSSVWRPRYVQNPQVSRGSPRSAFRDWPRLVHARSFRGLRRNQGRRCG